MPLIAGGVCPGEPVRNKESNTGALQPCLAVPSDQFDQSGPNPSTLGWEKLRLKLVTKVANHLCSQPPGTKT